MPALRQAASGKRSDMHADCRRRHGVHPIYGGTTGLPKGAELSLGNVTANVPLLYQRLTQNHDFRKVDFSRLGNDIVKLFVQLSAEAKRTDSQRWRDEILRFFRQNMAPYKIPRDIEFLETMPLTSLGKVDKKALRR